MHELPEKVNPNNHKFHFVNVHYKEVLGILKTLNSLKPAGIDNIPPKLVKDAAEEIA